MNKHPLGHSALRKGRVSVDHMVYLVTTTTLHRQPRFQHFPSACTAARCFEDQILLGDSRMLAWVLMPDHVHWLIHLGEGQQLASIINRLKSSSARKVNQQLNSGGTLWASAYHDRALRRDDDLRSAARYLVANPLRAGLARRIGEYPFWNAVWL
ncbi:hypothetical protein PKB_4075 [Pseudomonas knackmussii B13]|uniref:Transposase IS200-like domain-containing protein n=1 Tax=Pseudomonas knackmussii (strain DSM 6978 / CCUG 54928 / LMG 23759 / B13) TaxID=1301098 RepID=A0A024HL78_PSEKB|nr:transposase [Pseudomonas knackmussii]CDF85404.1 hypothetical protein PKB_4075 [Pseudomonas knackmussii B13]